ncbi:MAG: ABC transporter substrate-binding protein [Thaumarchaeota archaeon]|nr:ABC transporter substrate-binding protein [Nitrososphaerota archaeon]
MSYEATMKRKILVVPHFKRLHELIAYDNGYFSEVGLDVEFREDVFDETYNAPDFPRISGEKLATENTPSMNAACNWGVCVSAGANMGKLVNDVYMRTEHGIFVRPDSKIKEPKDLANVEVGVGELSGSHFSGILALEKYLPRELVKVKFQGGPATRLRKLMSGEIEAANLIPSAYYIAKELGYREIISGIYKTLLWAGNVTTQEETRAYIHALEKAQDAMLAAPARYKKYWQRLVPEDLKKYADVENFGLGEILVREPYSREEFDRTVAWMKSWGLTERMLENSYDKIIVRPGL